MKDYSKIPEELKNMNQWVCAWDNSKIPMKAFEKKAASSTAPDTWSSFEQAEWAVENGYYDNLGFVFADARRVQCEGDCLYDGDYAEGATGYTGRARNGKTILELCAEVF